MQEVLDEIGGVPFDDADRVYASAIQATLSAEEISQPFRRAGVPVRTDVPLCDWIAPRGQAGEVMIGSTDVADVSWAVPLVQVLTATMAIGTPFHTWQVTAQGKSPAAHKGMTHAALAMARCAERLFSDPALLRAAEAEHTRHLAAEPYRCPIPEDVMPPLVPRP
jgi:aminobenzoyl-glutamate utilization protein B